MEEKEDQKIKVGILIYQGVELLNLAGPGEVFAATAGFQVFTVGLNPSPVSSQGFVDVVPTYWINNCPSIDILVLPGGKVGALLAHQHLLCWIRSQSIKARHILSICTGAALLAKAGLLHGRKVTTFHSFFEELQQFDPSAILLPQARLTDNGQIITTAGISAGIDGALHLVARLKGEQVAGQTAAYMEYTGWPAPAIYAT